jgi:hypothetical protein
MRGELDDTSLTRNLGAPMPNFCHVLFCCSPILKQFIALVAFFPRFLMALFSHVLLARFLSTKRSRARLTFRHLDNPIDVSVDYVKIKIINA